MGRVVKWIAVILLVLVLLVIGAITAAVIFIDPNDYRDDIARLVEEETGRELNIEGDIRLSFWPYLGLELGRTQLADDPAFATDQPFVQIERANLAVRVLPLLRRQIEMDTIVLEGAQVRLIVDEQGRGNWESLVEEAADEPEPRPEEEPTEAPVTLADIGGLRLLNAAVSYEDRQSGERYQLRPLNLNIDRIRFGEPVALQADWVAQLPDELELAGQLSGNVLLDEAFERLAARDLDLRLTVSGADIPGGRQNLRLRAGRVDADLAAGRYSVPELRLDAAGVDLRAQLEALVQGEAVQATAQLDLRPFNARELMQRLDIELPEMADDTALTRVAGRLEASFADDQLSIGNLRLQLDDTTLQGTARVRSFDGPVADFKFAVDAIDLDRYLPPETEEEVAAADAEAPAEDLDLPVEMLRALVLNGEFSVGQIRVAGVRMADLDARISAQDGLLQLSPMTANLYQGGIAGALALDVRGEVPALRIQQRVTGVQSGPLLEDLLGDDWITGRGNVQFDLSMAGPSIDAWLANLNGNGRFEFDQATVKGINVVQEVRGAEARLRGRNSVEREERETDFAKLTGSFTARNGVIRNEDLLGQSPLMRITGTGSVNVPELTVDYLLTVNLVETLTGADGRELQDLRRIPIPMRIRGPLDDFSIRVDLREALMQLEGERIREAEREARERLAEEERRLRERAAEEERQLRERAEEEERRARERLEQEAERARKEAERKAQDAVRDLLRR